MRAAVLAQTGILLAGALLAPGISRAAEPEPAAAQRHLAETVGGDPSDFELVYETSGTDAGGAATWAGKLVDRRSGTIHPVYGLPGGSLGGVAAVDRVTAAALAARAPMARKADAPLRAAVAAVDPAPLLPVAVWLDVDTTSAETAVRDAHPEVEWLGTRPIVASLDQARALRGELWHARQGDRRAHV